MFWKNEAFNSILNVSHFPILILAAGIVFSFFTHVSGVYTATTSIFTSLDLCQRPKLWYLFNYYYGGHNS